jgi:type II secretory pathway pseudopilin PulG
MKKINFCGSPLLKNQQGFALISVYLVSMVILIVSAAAFSSVLAESRNVERERTRTQAYATAEAGLQTAMAQVGQTATAYTGFINTTAIPSTDFQSVTGAAVGSFSVNIGYPNQTDWVILTTTATVDGETRQLEGRVFLQSNLSKYLMYANATTIGLGTNLVLGANDGVNPQGVPATANDRAQLYYTNNLDFNGSNINVYGDTHAENFISGSSSNIVHGDTYVGGFTQDSEGRVTNDGINGTLTIGDGFNDDTDRDGNGTINANDYADRHDLLPASQQMTPYNQDARGEEVIDQVNLPFYQANNSSAAASRNYGTTTAERYFAFESAAGGTQTNVVVFGTLARFNAYDPFGSGAANTAARAYKTDEFMLPDGTTADKAILYNNGKAHVKGAIAGRVAVVASDDIFFDGNVKYSENNSYCSAQNSAAFLARDLVYFRPTSLEVSGIIYADKSSSSSMAVEATYNTTGGDGTAAKMSNGFFRHYGNLIVDGQGNTSVYKNRAYVYDPNLKYYRPPGLPVRPELRTVREI